MFRVVRPAARAVHAPRLHVRNLLPRPAPCALVGEVKGEVLCAASLRPPRCRHVRRPPRLWALGFADVWSKARWATCKTTRGRRGAQVNGHWRPQQRATGCVARCATSDPIKTACQ